VLHGFGPAVFGGVAVTLSVSALSLTIACGFGLLGAVAKLSRSRAARWAADIYTTPIRGLPDLELMPFIFYGGQIALNHVAERQGCRDTSTCRRSPPTC